MWKRKIYYALTPKQRLLFRKLYYFPSLVWDKLKNSEDTVPPKALIYTGRGDFVNMGNEYVEKLIKYAHLQPNSKVLDIGCGIGRIALPLTKYLSPAGKYEGFDVVKTGINWCKKNIESKYSNFHFKFTPIENDLYNNTANFKAENFRFPYQEQFDLITSISVFTHMQPKAVENYLVEISRLLSNEGYCFTTFFILSDEILQQQKEAENPFFPYHFDGYSLHNKNVRDANIGFHVQFLHKMIADAGLEVSNQFNGWWSGLDKQSCEDFQDILILKKRKK